MQKMFIHILWTLRKHTGWLREKFCGVCEYIFHSCLLLFVSNKGACCHHTSSSLMWIR